MTRWLLRRTKMAAMVSVSMVVAMAGMAWGSSGAHMGAANGQALIIGQVNSATANTSLNNAGSTGDEDAGFQASATDIGIEGNQTGFPCTSGGFPPCAGVVGTSDMIGVYGNGLFNGIGVKGEAAGDSSSPGVQGDTSGGEEPGPGVQGIGNPGVQADPVSGNPSSLALRVNGTAVFSRSGKLRIDAGRSTGRVGDIVLTRDSLVLAIVSNPHTPGLFVEAAVIRAGGDKFTVFLNEPAPVDTQVAWFIVN